MDSTRKFCPLAGRYCVEADCALWTSSIYVLGDGKRHESQQCAISKIASELDALSSRG